MADQTSRARVALLGLVGVAVVAAALVGHGLRPNPAEPAGSAGAAAARLSLTATIQLPRLALQPRTVNILVANHGPAPVRVRDAELRTESFAPVGPDERDVTIPAGAARGLGVRYGESRCGGLAAPAVAPATARLVVATGAGPWQTVELALPHPDGNLRVLLHADCAARRVAEVVEVAFGTWTAAPDGRLHGRVVLTRRAAGEPVVLHDLADNILFRLDPTGQPPLGRLDPGEWRLEIPLVADAGRCDGHAVGEVKPQHRYRFQVWVSVGEEERLPTTVAVDPATEDRLERMLVRRCGL